MIEHNTEDSIQVSDERLQERLRQEREAFEQHKTHENRWFILRLAMGYTAVFLLVSVMIVSSYILFNHAAFPVAVITSASVALFGDIVGLLIAIWKIILNRNYITKLAPVTQATPVAVAYKSLPDKPMEGTTGEITVLSATYGKGKNTKDVTGVIRSMVAAATTGCVRFTVNNENLGGDPLKKVTKELKVVYSYAGETHTKVILERSELSLP